MCTNVSQALNLCSLSCLKYILCLKILCWELVVINVMKCYQKIHNLKKMYFCNLIVSWWPNYIFTWLNYGHFGQALRPKKYYCSFNRIFLGLYFCKLFFFDNRIIFFRSKRYLLTQFMVWNNSRLSLNWNFQIF